MDPEQLDELGIQRHEYKAGDDQLMVVFVNNDQMQMVNPHVFAQALATDATVRRSRGWRLVSVSSMPMRQMGTAGNVFFQSGGQYATQAGLIALFVQDVRPPTGEAP